MARATPVPNSTGNYGDPTVTSHWDYLTILLQLLGRVRFDLLAIALLALVELRLRIPKVWLLSNEAVSVLGIAMSIFIGFRNTQAISRWWEARTLWEDYLNSCRYWVDGLRAYLSDSQWQSERTRNLVRLQLAQAWQLNFELRNFWHPDLRRMQEDLLGQLKLPQDSTVRSLSVARSRDIQHLHADEWITEMGRRQLVEITIRCNEAVGGLQRVRNTPIPPPYDMFVRLINWVFGSQLILAFKRSGSPTTGILLFVGFLLAERIGAYVEGPFDQDGTSFSLPLNTICCEISEDLMPGDLDYGRYRPCRNPVFWD